MKYAYFPGCAGHSTALDQELSTRAVLKTLNIALSELNDWNCCGASAGHTIGGELSNALNLRNLRIASDTQLDLLVPCASCFSNLKRAEIAAKHANIPKESTDAPSPSETVSVVSIVELLSKPEIINAIKARTSVDLSTLKLVTYYGCLLVRPNHIINDFNDNKIDSETPKGMEAVLSACGTERVEWPHKTDCCGGPHTVSHPELVTKCSSRLIEKAHAFGANGIVTACPMCHASLDTVQWEPHADASFKHKLPVFYLSELVGLALALDNQKNWLKRHLVDPRPFLQKQGVLK